MPESTGLVGFLPFALLAIVAPGVALQRLLRARVDPALVLPAGLVVCAASYWLSLATRLSALFPLALGALLIAGAWSRPPAPRTGDERPSLRGALPPIAALIAFLALTSYPFNRRAPDGGFGFDPVERIDTAFQVGVAWELSHSWPPQVPGLAGHELSYHFGQHLVRAAAVRWAGVSPYDLLSRFDLTLCGVALVLALRALAFALGARGFGLTLCGFAPLLADASFVAGSLRGADWWTDLFSANLHLALSFGNTLVPALALMAAALVAYRRHLDHHGRGLLALAAGLALAVPFFKVFLGWQLAAGLLLAFALSGRRSLGVLLLPLSLACVTLVLGDAGRTARLAFEPLAVVPRTAASLGWDAVDGAWLVPAALLWVVSALGLRVVALPEVLRALRAREPLGVALAGALLSGVAPALLVRISFVGEGRDYNEAVYFVTSSAALLWLFAALRLERWAARGRRPVALALTLTLALPSGAHFALRKATTRPDVIPAHVMRLLARLGPDGRAGDVVLSPTSPRYPPPALVLLGRRAAYTRFLPYLAQFAGRADIARRQALVREFFATRDAHRAWAIARELGATHLLLYGPQRMGIEPAEAFAELVRDGNAALYRLDASAAVRWARTRRQ